MCTYGRSRGNLIHIGARFLGWDTREPSGAGQSIACSVLEECTGLCEYTQARTPHTCYRSKITQVHSSQTNTRKLGPRVDVKAYLTLGCSGAKARHLWCLDGCERNWINLTRVRCLSVSGCPKACVIQLAKFMPWFTNLSFSHGNISRNFLSWGTRYLTSGLSVFIADNNCCVKSNCYISFFT